jgi:hypothetical protein
VVRRYAAAALHLERAQHLAEIKAVQSPFYFSFSKNPPPPGV